MDTIYKTAAGNGLIPQAGRSASTFPSGLVRVDQTYLGLTSQATTHRATLAVGNSMPDGDSSPCIDGLKIFPEPQEVRREDGFTEYKVSAYGRINTHGKADSNFESGFVKIYSTVIFEGQMTNSQNNVPCLNEILVFSKVVLANAFPTKNLPQGAVIRSWLPDSQTAGEYVLFQTVYPEGEFTEPSGGSVHSEITTTQSNSISAELVNNSSTLYGFWKEQVLTLRASAVVNKFIVYS
jgi:hypothetical protein